MQCLAQGDQTVAGTGGGQAERFSHAGDHHHADGHSVTVQNTKVTAVFNRMTDGMSQIQKLSHALFVFVFGDNVCLDGHTAGDQCSQIEVVWGLQQRIKERSNIEVL